MPTRDSTQVPQVLVQWADRAADETSWVDKVDIRGQFPEFSLEDKAGLNGGGVDREQQLIVYTRRKNRG